MGSPLLSCSYLPLLGQTELYEDFISLVGSRAVDQSCTRAVVSWGGPEELEEDREAPFFQVESGGRGAWEEPEAEECTKGRRFDYLNIDVDVPARINFPIKRKAFKI
eukprot:TRINITY_DN18998_c0_g1_i1.p2 TRINITY_DN18998_c0_g1~~TRINITY_DN18998_c0_g1_i1.p2  ORF type:complete len:107 (-),score=26.38 TRINITY_DN18998_c0_g1_i1:33-353(-)